MEGVEVGLVYEDRMVVGPGQAASLLIPGLPEVLATASLVAFVQLALIVLSTLAAMSASCAKSRYQPPSASAATATTATRERFRMAGPSA